MGTILHVEPEDQVPRFAGSKTSVGAVKHNEKMGCDAERLASGHVKTPNSAATMANDLLTPSDAKTLAAAATADGGEIDAIFTFPVEDKPIWAGLYESIHDTDPGS